jgi:Plasmid stabilization system protein
MKKRKEKIWRVANAKTADADIKEIVRFIARREGVGMGKIMRDRFLEAKNSLETMPERGRFPPELLAIHVYAYREALIGPYRMVYEVREAENMVYVHMVVDGRRDLPDLLAARLLGPGAGNDVQ